MPAPRRRALALLALLLFAGRAHAVSVSAGYAGYARGLLALRAQASLVVDGANYLMRFDFHTAGLIGFLNPDTSSSLAQGVLQADRAHPTRFASTGQLRGRDRRTEILYAAAIPAIRELVPPAQPERDPVDPAATAGTVDTLSAMVTLLRQVARIGRCDGSLTIFDGRRLSTLTARTVGQETLPRTNRSIYAGPALRCDFTGIEQAGFIRDESRASQQRPRTGSAWIATPPGASLPVAVKVTFEHRLLGQTTLFLTQIGN